MSGLGWTRSVFIASHSSLCRKTVNGDDSAIRGETHGYAWMLNIAAARRPAGRGPAGWEMITQRERNGYAPRERAGESGARARRHSRRRRASLRGTIFRRPDGGGRGRGCARGMGGGAAARRRRRGARRDPPRPAGAASGEGLRDRHELPRARRRGGARDSAYAGRLHEIPELPRRAAGRRRALVRVRRLGGRARRRDRTTRAGHRRERCAGSRRRLLHRAGHFRPKAAVRRQAAAVLDRKVARYLRPDRPRARIARRGARSERSRAHVRRRRRAHAGRAHERHDLLGPGVDRVSRVGVHPRGGRPDLHRHAERRRLDAHTAPLSRPRRGGRERDRGPRHAAQPLRRARSGMTDTSAGCGDDAGGIVRPARRPPAWRAPGPAPLAPLERADLWPRRDEDLCYLAGEWRILQRIDGHRWSLDDLVTAWCAATRLVAEPPRRLADLGCGIGSVLLLLAWRFPEARCVGVEAQEMSAALACRSIAWNGAAARCEIRHGDLRDPTILPDARTFDLVTGTPPYLPPGSATAATHVQRAQCRSEEASC